MRYSELADALIREIKTHGVQAYAIEERGGHPKLCFTFEGREIRFVFPATPSDHRDIENARSTIRRVMGVQRVIIKSLRPNAPCKPIRPKTVAPLAPLPKLTNVIIPDEFQKLAALRDRLTAAANENTCPVPEQGAPAPTVFRPHPIRLRTPWLGFRQRWQDAG